MKMEEADLEAGTDLEIFTAGWNPKDGKVFLHGKDLSLIMELPASVEEPRRRLICENIATNILKFVSVDNMRIKIKRKV